MRSTRVALLLLLATTLASPGQPAAAAAAADPVDSLTADGLPPIPPEIVELARPYTEIRSAAFLSWHPQRREMLISTRFGNTTQVHHVVEPGGARTQLTFFSEPVAGASYDPRDGRSFVLARDTGGAENYQLYRHDLATGRDTLLTDGRRRSFRGPWAHGGGLLATTTVDSDDRGAFTEVRVLDPARPEGSRLVATLRGGGWSVTDWSRDDRSLLLIERDSATRSALWTLDLAGGAPRRLVPEDPGLEVSWGGGHWSADGATVYTTTDREGEFRQLAALHPGDGTVEILSRDLPWDVSELELSPDGSRLAFLTNEDGHSRLYLLDLGSGARREVEALPAGVASGLRWHDHGRDLAVTLSTARSSGDVYVVDDASLAIERWTESETGGLDAARFVEPVPIGWDSFDGRRITGLLYQPDPARFPGRRPVIVEIHGGPEGQSRPGFRANTNLWANELGIAVIFPNVRGSTGYGKTFLGLDNGYDRVGSYEDIRTLLDWVATNPHLDAGRVMVTGGSYGGHMTFAVAARYSDRIRCSVPVVGITNLRSFLENTSGYRRDLRRVEYGDERDPKMRAFLDEIAPLNHAAEIGKPIFIVHGRNDPRVPVSESEQILQAVRGRGVPAWYLVAEDEGHGFRKKGNRSFQLYATVLFVRTYLLGDG